MSADRYGLPRYELQQLLINRIRAAVEAGDNDLARELRGAAAHLTGFTPRHIRRLVGRGKPYDRKRKKYDMNQEVVIDALMRYVVNGKVNRAAAYTHLVETGFPPTISESQFRRRYYDIPAERRGFIEGGPRERQNREPRIPLIYEDPFDALFLDGMVLKVWCRPPKWFVPEDNAPAIMATAINVIDHVTRALPGEPPVVPWTPRNDDIRLAYARATLPTPEWGPYHGVVGELHCDNLSTHLAFSLTRLLLVLDQTVIPSDPYQPQQNGAVEGFHNFVVKRILAPMPFFTGGRQALDGTTFQPPLEDLPPFEWVRDTYLAKVRDYNENWQIEDRGGKTPRQLWDAAVAEGRAPAPVSEEFARVLSHGERLAVVRRGAIEIDKEVYFDGLLGDETDRTVEVRNITPESLDVYDLNGRFLVRAQNAKTASDDTREGVRSARSARRKIDAERQERLKQSQIEEMQRAKERYAQADVADAGDFGAVVDELREAAGTAGGLNEPYEVDPPEADEGRSDT